VRSSNSVAKGASLYKSQKSYEIRVSPNSTNAFQNFLIAHELGHYLIEREFSRKPLDKNEYWKHEELCDAFARNIILSEQYMCNKVQKVKLTPEKLMALSVAISKEKEVTWATAAFRITDFSPNVAFFQINHISKNNNPLFKVKVSTHTKNKKAIHAEFSEDSEFGLFLRKLNESSIIEHNLIGNPIVARKCPFLKNASKGFVSKVTDDVFRLTLIFENHYNSLPMHSLLELT
jgi:Zn-dependent peptidase ImmA (M78 family)